MVKTPTEKIPDLEEYVREGTGFGQFMQPLIASEVVNRSGPPSYEELEIDYLRHLRAMPMSSTTGASGAICQNGGISTNGAPGAIR